MVKKVFSIILRVFAVILIGLVSAVIGFIAGVIVIGTLSPFVELLFGFEITFNGREGYEAGGPLGLIAGAIIGLIGSGLYLFRKPTAKRSLTEENAK
jgi:hypothetical protein